MSDIKEFDRTDLANEISAVLMEVHQDGSDPIYTPAQLVEVLQAFSAVLANALVEHQRVEIHELGVFKLQKRAPEKGVTPTGQIWETPERLKVTFHAAPALTRIVSERTGVPAF